MAMPRSDSASPLHYPISGWIEAGLFVVAIAVKAGDAAPNAQ